MKRNIFTLCAAAFIIMNMPLSCEILDNDPDKHANTNDSTFVGLEEVAEILASLPLKTEHLSEVHTAVTSSSGNGYDEEYTMKHLFETPGKGVGDRQTKGSRSYEEPLRELIEDYVYSGCVTKSGDGTIKDPDRFLEVLMASDIQIYWPFSETWDGESLPIITFDPEDGSEVNIGYRLIVVDGSFRQVEEVLVDEEMAMQNPVWVVNRNTDAGFASLEMLRREDPDWGEGGGNIVVKPKDEASTKAAKLSKCLLLKELTLNENLDSWLAGGSELFLKMGYLPDFTASTEAELRLYNPLITDLMIVVKRKQVGKPLAVNAILMSDWYEHEDVDDACAFMLIEDDGGTRESWSTKAKVFVAGKSYGIEVTIPLNSRDDIIWRGMLTRNWLEKSTGNPWTFGEADLTFELQEY